MGCRRAGALWGQGYPNDEMRGTEHELDATHFLGASLLYALTLL